MLGGNLTYWDSCVHTRTSPLRRIPSGIAGS